MELFGSYLRMSQMDFPLHFNFAQKGSGFFFPAGKQFCFAKWLVFTCCSRGGPQSLDFLITYFISDYSYPQIYD